MLRSPDPKARAPRETASAASARAFARVARIVDHNRPLAGLALIMLVGLLVTGVATTRTASAMIRGAPRGAGGVSRVVVAPGGDANDRRSDAPPKAPSSSADNNATASASADAKDERPPAKATTPEASSESASSEPASSSESASSEPASSESDPSEGDPSRSSSTRNVGKKDGRDSAFDAFDASSDSSSFSPTAPRHDLTRTWHGVLALLTFFVGYGCAISEDRFGRGFKKSIPVTIAAGIVWALVALGYRSKGHRLAPVTAAAKHTLGEFVEVFLFLLTAMTFINAAKSLNVFAALRRRIVRGGYGRRAVFWITGAAAFALSPVADNLTTACVMGAVVSSLAGVHQTGVHGANRREHDANANANAPSKNFAPSKTGTSSEFAAMCCVNVVVAANAGGAFSPFGDLTTLMVWQRGKLGLGDFPRLFLPALTNWLVPAALMSRRIEREPPGRGGGGGGGAMTAAAAAWGGRRRPRPPPPPPRRAAMSRSEEDIRRHPLRMIARRGSRPGRWRCSRSSPPPSR